MGCNFLSLPVTHWRNRNLALNHRYNTFNWHILNKGNSTPMDSLKRTLFLCPSNKFPDTISGHNLVFTRTFVMHNLILCKDMSKIYLKLSMITFWHGNGLRITGLLWGESTDHRCSSQGSIMWSLNVFLLTWTNCWTNGRFADRSKHHDAHVTSL